MVSEERPFGFLYGKERKNRMERLVCLAVGYAFGLIQTGYLCGKFKKKDIRTLGSGNAGTTNALRTLGWKAGLITFLGDVLKCVIATGVVTLLYGKSHPDTLLLLVFYAGLGAVLGHNYPFYMEFKGGKGIAATGGLVISTLPPYLTLLCLAIFVLVIWGSKYVSLGSLVGVTAYLVIVLIYGGCHKFHVDPSVLREIYIIAVVLEISAIFKHKDNIKRLLNGTENKLSIKKKDE